MHLSDYLATEFASFDEEPFGPLDSAVLSQLIMVRCGGIVPFFSDKPRPRAMLALRRALPGGPKGAHLVDLLRADKYDEMFTGLIPGRIKDNLLALAASPRFKPLVLHDYTSSFDEERQTQFAALSLSYGKEFTYVGFRGTDTSVTGWRENFNMACTSPVPAQEEARRYLEGIAQRTRGRLIVGGHSKGGNLALYAALKANPAVQKRIERVYSHDGPGFKAGVIADMEWEALAGRIHRTVPRESIVGMLMGCPVEPRVVQADQHGLDQHSPFTWQVEGNDFVYADGLSDSSLLFVQVMDEWLARYNNEDLERIVEALFKAIEASGSTNATEIFFAGPKLIPLITRAAQQIDEESRGVLLEALGCLAEVTARNAGRGILERIAAKR